MILATKLRNLIQEANKGGLPLEFSLRNITINGEKRGCSGHVVNTKNQSCVYVNTEEVTLESLKGKSMFRLAENTRDWSSNGLVNGNNRWCKNTELPREIVHLLASETPKKRRQNQ